MASTDSGDKKEEAQDNQEEPQCSTCHKNAAELGNPLKRCAKCHTSWYCSRECQKNDWKSHKKTCGTKASGAGASSSSSSRPGEAGNPFAAIQEKRFFDDKPEKQAFAHIIDSYRMRVDDEMSYMGNHRGLYNEEDPVADFKKYLNKCEARGVLPKWWDAKKRKACVAYGRNTSNWSDLSCAVEKHDIIEHYKNPMMPMFLRMVAEMVEGSNVMGQPAGQGLQTLGAAHARGGAMSTFSMA